MKTTKTTNMLIIILSPIIFVIIYKLLKTTFFDSKVEGFTSGLSKIYRPYLRNIRLFGSKYYNKIKTSWHIFFKKLNII